MAGSAFVNIALKPLFITLAAAFTLVLALHFLGPILMPFMLGAVLAYMGDPVVDRLEAKGLSRTLAVVVVFVSFTLLSLIMFLITLPLLIEQVQLLMQRVSDGLAWLQSTLLPMFREQLDLPEQGKSMDSARQAISSNLASAGGLIAYAWSTVSSSSVAIISWLANITLVPVVTFYLLRDWDVLVAAVRELLPRAAENKVVDLAVECDDVLGAFARGQLLVMAALALIYTAGLLLLGLELALVLGVTAGLASIVPYMGFVVGISSALLVAFFQFDSWLPLLGVMLVFGVGQMLESMVLTPKLVGERIGLHPVLVIFAILAGGQLFGFLGVLIALPVAAVFKVMALHLLQAYRESEFYGRIDQDIEEVEI